MSYVIPITTALLIHKRLYIRWKWNLQLEEEEEVHGLLENGLDQTEESVLQFPLCPLPSSARVMTGSFAWGVSLVHAPNVSWLYIQEDFSKVEMWHYEKVQQFLNRRLCAWLGRPPQDRANAEQRQGSSDFLNLHKTGNNLATPVCLLSKSFPVPSFFTFSLLVALHLHWQCTWFSPYDIHHVAKGDEQAKQNGGLRQVTCWGKSWLVAGACQESHKR